MSVCNPAHGSVDEEVGVAATDSGNAAAVCLSSGMSWGRARRGDMSGALKADLYTSTSYMDDLLTKSEVGMLARVPVPSSAGSSVALLMQASTCSVSSCVDFSRRGNLEELKKLYCDTARAPRVRMGLMCCVQGKR